MEDHDQDWISQGPLTLLGILHRIPIHLEIFLTKYDPNKETKAEYHLHKFYLHLQMVEVIYKYVSCRLFPCTLDGRGVIWYHSLPVNQFRIGRGLKKGP